MIVLGTVLGEDGEPIEAAVQCGIFDTNLKDIVWGEKIIAGEDGTYQAQVIVDPHSLSKDAEVIVAAWGDVSTDREALKWRNSSQNPLFAGTQKVKAEFPVTKLPIQLKNMNTYLDDLHFCSSYPEKYRKGEFFDAKRCFCSDDLLSAVEGCSIFPRFRIFMGWTWRSNNHGGWGSMDLQYYCDGTPLPDAEKGFYVSNDVQVNFQLILNKVGGSYDKVIYKNIQVKLDESIETCEGVNTTEEIELKRELAFFTVKNRGIVNGLFEASVFSTKEFDLQEVIIKAEGNAQTITDFAKSGVSWYIPGIQDKTEVEVTATFAGVFQGKETTFETKQLLKAYTSIQGEINLSLDSDTGIRTAYLSFDNEDQVSSILWQITFESTVIEKIVKVQGATEKAFINILYQEETLPSNRELEFETLKPGRYIVSAQVSNKAGISYEIKKELFISGSDSDEEEFQIGDSFSIGCVSDHGEIPMMTVYKLSMDGYEEIKNVPMEHAFEQTYFYNHTVEETDCFYIFRAANSIVTKKVGKPSGCTFCYNKKKAHGLEIPFKITDFEGEVLEDSMLEDSGIGIYYKVFSPDSHGVLQIGKVRKVI